MPPQPVVAAGVTAAAHVALSPSRTHVEPWVSSSGPPCPQGLALPSAGQGGDAHPGLLASHWSFSHPWRQVSPQFRRKLLAAEPLPVCRCDDPDHPPSLTHQQALQWPQSRVTFQRAHPSGLLGCHGCPAARCVSCPCWLLVCRCDTHAS